MFRRISQENRHFRIQDADRPRHACYFVHPVLFKYRGRWRVHLPRLCEWTRGSGEKQLGRTFKTHHRLHVHNVKFVPPKMPMLGDPHSLSQLFWSEFFLGWTLETHWWHHWLLLSINSHHFKSSKGFCPEQPWEKKKHAKFDFLYDYDEICILHQVKVANCIRSTYTCLSWLPTRLVLLSPGGFW